MNRPQTWIVVVAVVVLVVLAAPPAGRAADGKETFLAQKCNLCHSVESAGIARKTDNEKTNGPDLTGVAERHDGDWITKFVKKEVEKDGKAHKKEYKGTDEDLKVLVDWLLTQKKG